MKKPKSPELKMPDLKAPGFVADLYYDLRDRRLLPLIALVLVAIVATPFLLGQKTETTVPPATPGVIQALKEERGQQTASLTVVEAKPGLRDYRKRLQRRKPLDPFRSLGKPNLEEARLGKGAGGETSSSSSSSSFTSTSTTVKKTENSTTTTTTTGGSGGGAPATGANPVPGGDGEPHAILFNFAVNLRIVHVSGSDADGSKETSEPDIRKKVLPSTTLPSEDTQVVTYMGISPKTRKPLFLVSTDVTGVFGEGKCVAGTENCQLIELEPGFPETFEYGEDGERYKFKVTKVEVVVTGRL